MSRAFIALAIFLCPCFCMSGGNPVFMVDKNKPCQTMEHFGASDCWTMQFMGQWPVEKQEQVADWLFSTECDKNGQPLGIGLSLWRFNIGAGSHAQNEKSGISSYFTRTECFLDSAGNYDWNKQAGQRSFLRLAKERGVNNFVGFMNSVPVYYTQNGLATNTGRDGTANIKAENYKDVAAFVAEVIMGIEKKDGVKLNYLSPFNEPDGSWNWTGNGQEGSPATNREIARMVRLIDREFEDRGIDTRIVVPESSNLNYLFRTSDVTQWERSSQIQSFFNPDSTDTYIGNLNHVPRLVVGHSYWTNTPLSTLRSVRSELQDTLRRYDVDFWQTETCIMSNDEEVGYGGGFDTTMKTALYVARIIHHDIVLGGASSWQWWRAVGEDYKDGLIREFSDYPHRDGTVIDSKLMWSLGNFSRFVRPGAVRYGLLVLDDQQQVVEGGDTDPTGIMCSAYRNTDNTWVFVVINYSQEDRTIGFSLGKGDKKKWRMYRTSDVEGENLKPVGVSTSKKPVVIPARSIVSIVSSK